jgi:hypothetical protein
MGKVLVRGASVNIYQMLARQEIGGWAGAPEKVIKAIKTVIESMFCT